MIVAPVTEADLDDLLPLMRGYCDFYAVAPTDAQLLDMSRALLADPEREGVQFIARREGEAIGFATVFWTWSTLSAARLGVMNDLFVAEVARGSGAAEALIGACAEAARGHGCRELSWQTAKDNHRAQAVYERVGAERSEWLDYVLHLRSA